MQLIIEGSDFARMTARTRQELLDLLEGRAPVDRPSETNPTLRWRRPVDLTGDLARKLVHGLAVEHLKRLGLFARGDGRVAMSKLLAATKDRDLRVLSHFEGVLTRKLRRLVNDHEKKATLLGWDYDSTRWSEDGTTIVDGIYYVTPSTVRALGAALRRRSA
jgi:hypothetical protein